MLRSELKVDQYVRVTSEMSDSFWERFALGRYFQVKEIDPSPDDATSCGPCRGTLCFWGMNYYHQMFNGDMEPISPEEEAIVKSVFTDKEKFAKLHKLGRKFDRLMEKLDDLCCGYGHVDVWDYGSLEHLLEDVFCGHGWDDDLEEEIKEVYEEILEILINLNEAEQRLIRDSLEVAV